MRASRTWFGGRVGLGGISIAVLTAMTTVGCGGGTSTPPKPAAGSGDAAFDALVGEVLQDHYTRNPTSSVDLGLHQFDADLDDFSRAAVDAEVAAARGFKSRLEAVDAAALS